MKILVPNLLIPTLYVIIWMVINGVILNWDRFMLMGVLVHSLRKFQKVFTSWKIAKTNKNKESIVL